MRHFTITVGLGFDKTGKHIDPVEQVFAIDKMKHSLATQFGGYSAQSVNGGYVNKAGALTQEDAIRFDVVAPSAREGDIHEFAIYARDLLAQESVLLEASQELTAEFV